MDKEKEATASAMTSYNQNKDSKNIPDNEEKEVIIPDNSTLDSTITLPTWGISHLEYYINHITEVFGCPREYVVFSVMSAISTAIGKNIQSFDGKYYNYPLLWGMLVGEQGVNKSEPLKQAFMPLYKMDEEVYKQYEIVLSEWKDSHPKPVYKHTILGDSTPEYKYSLLRQNDKGIVCLRDEIASKFAEVNRYNNNSEIETELSIFSNSPISITRKSEEPILISNPFMNQIGTIQPDILVKCMGNKFFINNGYLSRWLFVYPDKTVLPKYSNTGINNAIISRYYEFLRTIAKYGNIGIINYSAEAKKLYIDYFNSLQDKIMKCRDSYQSGIYAKLQIHIQRWALAVYTARLFEVNEKTIISGEIMQYAIECMEYFEYTALKVRDMIVGKGSQIKEINDAELIRMFYKRFKPNMKVQEFADFMDKSRPYISKVINKK